MRTRANGYVLDRLPFLSIRASAARDSRPVTLLSPSSDQIFANLADLLANVVTHLVIRLRSEQQRRSPAAYFRFLPLCFSMTNSPNVRPRSIPLPVPENARETVPLVTTCAADAPPIPAWTSAEA